MEPRPGFKARGSFGTPPQMLKDLEESRKKAGEEAARPSQQPPPQVNKEEAVMAPPIENEAPADPKKPKEITDAEREAEYVKFKAELEKDLETTLTVEDIKEYVFRGRITKEVQVIPGVLNCTFQTLNPSEHLEIDKRVASFQNEGAYTSEGIANQRSLVTLSYVWIAAGGKPLSAKNDPIKREEAVRKCGVDIVDAVSKAYQKFKTLVSVVMQEKTFIKKP
jgi:hypothetical protein